MRTIVPIFLLIGCAGRGDRIRATELYQRLEENPSATVVVDVRSDREWRGGKGHIPGAQHQAWPGVKETAGAIEAGPDQTVVLVCFTGHRSQWAMEAVKAAVDAREVIDLRGGMMAWWRKDLPVEVEGSTEGQ